MRSMPGLICEIRHFVVPQGVAASCSGVFQALTGELAGYLRFKGVIFGRRNIYLHFKGLLFVNPPYIDGDIPPLILRILADINPSKRR